MDEGRGTEKWIRWGLRMDEVPDSRVAPYQGIALAVPLEPQIVTRLRPLPDVLLLRGGPL